MESDYEIDEFYQNLKERKEIIKSFLEFPSDELEETILGWGEECSDDYRHY